MKTLVVILGPTGVGKTELSLRIAEWLSSPIINADSRQIYRDLPIGTAAPTAQQLQRIHHYFVGTLSLEQYYSAARFETEVLDLLSQLFQEKEALVMTGGSMLYIDAVCQGIDDIPTVEADTRAILRARYNKEGIEPLLAELHLLDPQYYSEVDLRNTQRVIHALEICYQTGRPFSSYRQHIQKERPFRIIKIGLNRPREELFARINARVAQMIDAGWLDEVRRVEPYRHCNSLNTVGYKELFRYLDNQWTLEEALLRIAKNTRVYAKKQLTWFKRDETIRWFNPADEESILSYLQEQGVMG